MYYGIGETIKHTWFLAYTKLFWPGARMIRMPVYARTKKNIRYGRGLTTGYGCKLAATASGRIIIGEDVILGDYVQVQCCNEVTFGDHVLVASRVYIGDSGHGFYSGTDQTGPEIPPNERRLNTGSVHIGNNVWIGNGVTIAGNVRVGDGTVIGANSVVVKDLDANSVYAGVPARKIKQWNETAHQWEIVH